MVDRYSESVSVIRLFVHDNLEWSLGHAGSVGLLFKGIPVTIIRATLTVYR